MVKFEINELTGILRPIPQLKQSAPEVPGMNKKGWKNHLLPIVDMYCGAVFFL
jgi:hypothetical protein